MRATTRRVAWTDLETQGPGGRACATASRTENAATCVPVAAALSPGNATDAASGAARSARLRTGCGRQRVALTDPETERPYGRPGGTASRFERPDTCVPVAVAPRPRDAR